MLTVGIRASYLCLGVLYVVATVGFSLCVYIGCVLGMTRVRPLGFRLCASIFLSSVVIFYFDLVCALSSHHL